VLLDFQNLARGVSVVAPPGRRKKRFRDFRTVLRGAVPCSLMPACLEPMTCRLRIGEF
jgi:hypothetical protein